MKIKEVATALELFAPLPLQESYDNAGLQVGLTEAEDVSGVLLCLDVTEDVVEEAVRRGCNLIVAHHPLLFRGVKCVDDRTIVTRTLRRAIERGVGIYAAHTNLDNARGGVNWEIAERLELQNIDFLEPHGTDAGSGAIGTLAEPMSALDFLRKVKDVFGVEAIRHNAGPERPVQRIALCGGAGDFLVDAAIEKGADVFLTGEVGYHRFFGYERQIWLAALGHYESEQFTPQLMARILRDAFPGLKLCLAETLTNPIHTL